MSTAFLMRRFGECNHGEIAIDHPGSCIYAEYRGGHLRVTVDCYSWMNDSGEPQDFDVDAWDRQRLILEDAPKADMRAAWYEAYRLARAFRSGLPIQIGDQPPFSMLDWVAKVERIYFPVSAEKLLSAACSPRSLRRAAHQAA